MSFNFRNIFILIILVVTEKGAYSNASIVKANKHPTYSEIELNFSTRLSEALESVSDDIPLNQIFSQATRVLSILPEAVRYERAVRSLIFQNQDLHVKQVLISKQRELLFNFEELIYSLSNQIQKKIKIEVRDLSSQIALSSQDPDRTQVRSLSIALRYLLTQLNSFLEKTPLKGHAYFVLGIQECRELKKYLVEQLKRVDLLLPTHPIEGPLIQFGSAEWKSLYQQRIPIPKTRFYRYFEQACNYLAPSRWFSESMTNTDRLRKMQGILLIGMIAGNQVYYFYHLSQAMNDLDSHMDEYLKKLVSSLNENDVRKIRTETSLLGTVLSDKYQAIQDPAVRDQLFARYPQVKSYLNQLVQILGDRTPSKEDVSNLMDNYFSLRVIQETQEPGIFSSRGAHLWWNRFFQSSDDKICLSE